MPQHPDYPSLSIDQRDLDLVARLKAALPEYDWRPALTGSVDALLSDGRVRLTIARRGEEEPGNPYAFRGEWVRVRDGRAGELWRGLGSFAPSPEVAALRCMAQVVETADRCGLGEPHHRHYAAGERHAARCARLVAARHPCSCGAVQDVA